MKANWGIRPDSWRTAGRIIALGGAGPSCGDALWEAEVWVAGDIESLGVDAKIVEPEAEEIEGVDALLKKTRIGRTVSRLAQDCVRTETVVL